MLSRQMPADGLGYAADTRIEGFATCPTVVIGGRLGLGLAIAPLHGASLPREPVDRSPSRDSLEKHNLKSPLCSPAYALFG